MRYYTHFYLILFNFLLPILLFAQNRHFTHITTEDIAEKADIQALYQDQKGFIWVGSFDGLVQYDGVKSKVFKRRHSDSNSLNHNIIYGITENEAAIWAVAWGNGSEICRIDKQTSQVKRIKLDKGSNAMDNILRLKNGNFVIGGSDDICFFNPITYEHVKVPSSRSFATLELTDGTVWAATVNKKRLICRPQQGINYKIEVQSLDYQINALCKTSDNRIWLGTTDGLKTGLNDRLTIPNDLKKVSVTALCFGSDSALWVGTERKGLYRWHIQTNNLQHFEAQDKVGTLTGNAINVLMEDTNHLLWIGTTQGLNRTDLTPSVFQTLLLPPKSILDHNNSFSIMEDKNGLMWVGTDALFVYDLKTQRYQSKSFPLKNITSITKNKQGNIWVSTWTQGAYKFKGLTNFDAPFQVIEHLTVENKSVLFSNLVLETLEDNRGNTWFGTYDKGFSVKDAKGKWHNNLRQKIGGAAVSNIIQAQDSTLWLTVADGVVRLTSNDLEKPQFEHYGTKNGLSYTVVADIFEDKNGHIWIATVGGGINRINPETKAVKIFTEENGLPSNSVVGILEDESGFLWISTFNGLARFNPLTEQFTVYKTKDGLIANGFKFFSKYKNAQGELFFGTNQGMVYFNPQKLTENKTEMPIYLTDLKLFNQSVTPSVQGSVLTKNIGSTDTLIIPYDKSVLTLEFAALFYKNPEQLQYAYLLENFDKDWNYIGNSRSATYTYPPPGTYYFKVKATANGNNWVEIQKPILLIIKPLWYQTVWFRGGLIAFLFLGAYGLYRYRLHTLHVKQKEALDVIVKTQEQERHRFAQELHDGVGANLSLLKLYLNSINDKRIPQEELQRRSVSVLNDSVEDIRRLIHDLSPRTLASVGLKQALAEFVHRVNDTGKVTIQFAMTDTDERLSHLIEINVFRMVQELLQNTLKYAHAQTVQLNIEQNKQQISVHYQDDGKGFDMAQALETKGNGLKNMKERIQMLDGRIDFQSKIGEGFRAKMAIPIGK